MKFKTLRTMAYTALVATTVFAGAAIAEDQTLNVSANVQNTVSMSEISGMNFGTIVAINEAGNQASIVLDTTGNLGAPTNSGGAVIFSTDNTNVANGDIEVVSGAGATVNVTVDGLVQPVNAGDELVLSDFTIASTSAGITETTITMGGSAVPYTSTGTDNIFFGATLSTPDEADLNANGAYAGSFVVSANY